LPLTGQHQTALHLRKHAVEALLDLTAEQLLFSAALRRVKMAGLRVAEIVADQRIAGQAPLLARLCANPADSLALATLLRRRVGQLGDIGVRRPGLCVRPEVDIYDAARMGEQQPDPERRRRQKSR
jgi:hypothetical protein